ncbi:hypothetical protein CRENBAI_012530, partial [Crenichthys baileyi]
AASSAAPRLTPVCTPVSQVPTREGGIGTSIGQKARERDQPLRTDRKPGPTPPAPHETIQTLKPRSTALTPSPPPEGATDPQQKAEKRADQPAQHNQNMPHKGGHMTNMPNHPQTTGQSQQSAQSTMPGTRPQPQPGEAGAPKRTSVITNTEVLSESQSVVPQTGRSSLGDTQWILGSQWKNVECLTMMSVETYNALAKSWNHQSL